MEYYAPIKHLHVTFVAISISFFCIRAYWSITGAAMLQNLWVKVVPHIIDSALLFFGLMLVVMVPWSLGDNPWLVAKLVGLVFYIGFGTIAIKRGRTALIRFAFTLVTLVVFSYILGCAIEKSAWSWGILF